jgi:hypothetical protein
MSRNQIKKMERSPPPPAAPTKSNIANDIASNVVSGFTFGIGSSMARHAVDSIFTSKPPNPKPESSLHSEYLECLKHNHEDTCKAFYESM